MPAPVTYFVLIICLLLGITIVMMVLSATSAARHQRRQQERALEARRAAAGSAAPDAGGEDGTDLPPIDRILAAARPLVSQVAYPYALAGSEAFGELADQLAAVADDTELVRHGVSQDEALAVLALVAIARRGEAFTRRAELLSLLPDAPVLHIWYGLRAVAHCGEREEPVAGEMVVAWALAHDDLEAWARIPAFRVQFWEFLGWRTERDDPFVFAPADLERLREPRRRRDVAAFLQRMGGEPGRSLLRSLGSLAEEDADAPGESAPAQPEPQADLADLAALGRIHHAGVAAPWRRPAIAHPALQEDLAWLEHQLTRQDPRPCLVVGEPGTGRRTLLNLLVRRLVKRGWVALEAGHGELLAGQSYVGQFEKRLEEFRSALRPERRLWLVPDLGQLEHTGRHRDNPTSALDLLLPDLEAGTLLLTGPVTPAALERLQQRWPRLREAVQVRRLDPLPADATAELARRWLEQRTGAAPLPPASEAALAEAHQLADHYLHDHAAPGNLLALLERVMHRREDTGAEAGEPLSRGEVLAALGERTGLPDFLLDERQTFDPDRMRAFFATRILGQPEAVESLVQRIALMKAGLADPDRPRGVFLFAGPTGTGKTEIAKTLATFLFGSPDRLARLDLSEYATPGAAERLLQGSPAETAGGPQGAESLAARIRRQPFSVVLLDEFEKAAPDVWNLFLQVFDEGRLTDARGVTTDFRHTFVLMTSNLGAAMTEGTQVGFARGGAEFHPADVQKAIDQVFSPEFRNRIDRIVVFKPLTREVMREILQLELAKADARRGLHQRDWAIVWDEAASELLLDRGFSRHLGARPLRRAIERHFLAPLAELIASGRIPTGDQFVFVEAQDDRLVTRFVDPDADEGEAGDPIESRPAAELSPAAIAADPRGGGAELAALQAAHADLAARVAEPAWRARKDADLAATSAEGFWDDPGRFVVLDRIERLDRLEHGVDAAATLLERLVGPGERPAGRRDREPPRDLVARLADQLRLLQAAHASLAADQPWDAFLQVDLTGSPQPAAGVEDWAERLVQMYRRWARARRMRLEVLRDRRDASRRGLPGGAHGPGEAGPRWCWLASVSGLAAWTLLRGEDGVHVWEQPETDGATPRLQARVRVVPRPTDLDGDALQLARRTLDAPSPGSLRIVRVYRAEPAPLVRDRLGGWRSGRLERVLAGHFDLEAASRRARRGASGD